jgi:DNA-binding NarL/FixJ family response regulator
LLADIIKQLVAGEIRLDVVARFDKRALLWEKLPEIAPDLVLVGLRSQETDRICRSLLHLLPIAKVIAFSSDARKAYIHEMRPHRAALIDVSAQALIGAIRGPGQTPMARLDLPPNG